MTHDKLLTSLIILGLVPTGLLACPADTGDEAGDELDVGDGDTETGETETGETETGETGEGPTVDGDAVAAEAAGYADNFTKINVAPIMSQHGGAMVNVWVKNDYVDAYRAVDPGNPTETTFSPGTLIVKEHLDMEGMPAAMTIMFKADAGYAPDHGDWWWGMGDPMGNLMDSGPALAGCVTACHSNATVSDWVFGVDPANQTP